MLAVYLENVNDPDRTQGKSPSPVTMEDQWAIVFKQILKMWVLLVNMPHVQLCHCRHLFMDSVNSVTDYIFLQ